MRFFCCFSSLGIRNLFALQISVLCLEGNCNSLEVTSGKSLATARVASCEVLLNPIFAAIDKDREFLLLWVPGTPEKLEVS